MRKFRSRDKSIRFLDRLLLVGTGRLRLDELKSAGNDDIVCWVEEPSLETVGMSTRDSRDWQSKDIILLDCLGDE